MDQYIYRNGKKLKYGFTTGTCATAATKAAVITLLTGKPPKTVKLQVPKGWILELPIEVTKTNENSVLCGVRKDAGDDPDVTHDLLICSKVQFHDKNEIIGGIGVGRVTKEGLPVSVGKAAINPVPMKMIESVLKNKKNRHFLVEISVPEGKNIAKRTFNPKLGILDGISILGTSGIVEPMSLEAIKDSIIIEFDQMKNYLKDAIVLCPGNYGQDYTKKLSIDKQYILKISNFVGFFLERLVESGIKNVLFVGHIGKLIKVAAGNFNTHSKVSDARIETLVAYGALHGVSKEVLEKVFKSVTTDGAIEELLPAINREVFFQTIVDQIKNKMESHVYQDLNIEIIMFSNKHVFLGQTKGVGALIHEKFKNK